jgi:hypothetical protein
MPYSVIPSAGLGSEATTALERDGLLFKAPVFAVCHEVLIEPADLDCDPIIDEEVRRRARAIGMVDDLRVPRCFRYS